MVACDLFWGRDTVTVTRAKILPCNAMMFTNLSWDLKSKSLAKIDAPWPNHQAKADVGGGRWLHIANSEQTLFRWPASCHVCIKSLKDMDTEGRTKENMKKSNE